MQARIPVAIAISALALVPTALGAAGDVSRASLTSGGRQVTGATSGADGPVVSADGTKVLFASSGAFGGASTGGLRQLFLRDASTGTTTLVSASAAGTPGSRDADDDPAREFTPYGLSYDGRYVVFSSTATNLVASDGNGTAPDVFRKDLLTGRVAIVSRDLAGAQPSLGVAGQPSVSADGMRVAFTAGNQPLLAADTNGVADVYVADLRARTLVLASRSMAGRQSPTAVGHPAISADGRSVAFDGDAAAKVIAPDDANAVGDIYVTRLATGAITTPSASGVATDARLPAISGNGRRLAFLKGDEAWVRDTSSGTSTLASTARSGGNGGAVGRPAMSADGDRVAYASSDTPAVVTAFTASTSTRTPISQASTGVPLTLPAGRAALSGDGATGAFSFNDNTLALPRDPATVPVPDDTNDILDVFTTRLGGANAIAPALTAAAAANGGKVVISGRASDATGITGVTVAGRRALVADDGAWAVTLTPGVGPQVVTATAVNGLGRTTTAQVATDRAWAAALSQTVPARPRNLRATANGATVTVRFRMGLPGRVRAEVRRRVPGNVHAQGYKLIVGRTTTGRTGAVTMRLRLPASTPRGGRPYQVRVMASTSRGMGTAATTIILN